MEGRLVVDLGVGRGGADRLQSNGFVGTEPRRLGAAWKGGWSSIWVVEVGDDGDTSGGRWRRGGAGGQAAGLGG